ncbi:FAD-dependent oxidoreductase [Mesorhizobium sp. NZP2077]|uniref:FAD-dependent oxidoreductase n=1 Tax=Mesorhizobium sp. NZP2077 TaxID=2483404 RepID=UPI0015575A31|nr:FAD-dependent oxidoreductase [Mesorhizobium sp. NZP2077]QKC86726.1 FAD-dependent oxidoreductase [Mesorhizobium sp. NZP2077]QKD20423.1 FAD-dependent oxidoreductase [Mesorhizobium sp. NZP2077]
MVFALLKYGFSRRYPERDEIPRTPDLQSHYDVVIIGGGGHGASLAYHLAKHHGITNVAILEKGYLGGGNTARNTTVIRSNYTDQRSIRFYAKALRLYESLANELDYNMMYSRRGQLTLSHSDGVSRSLRLRADAGVFCGEANEIVDRQQIRSLVPSLNLDIKGMPILCGLWHPSAAIARHDAVVWGYAIRACERGVELHQRTEVLGMELSGNRVTRLRTNRGDVSAGTVVQCVAGYSSVVAKMAGLKLPIRSYPLQAMVTHPVKPFLDPMVSSTALHCYVSQSARGELVIGGGSDPYELYNTRSTLELKESLAASALEMFPFIGELKILRQWAGITDMTPDYSPIMGQCPLSNYWLDAGWGTWGFKATPASGFFLAKAISENRIPDEIRPFQLSRFHSFDLVNEMGATAASH